VQTFCMRTLHKRKLGDLDRGMSTKVRPALAAFRRLMRAREMAFKGDTEMLVQSRLAVREEFLRHKVALPCSASMVLWARSAYSHSACDTGRE
jgi:hypothetical protein